MCENVCWDKVVDKANGSNKIMGKRVKLILLSFPNVYGFCFPLLSFFQVDFLIGICGLAVFRFSSFSNFLVFILQQTCWKISPMSCINYNLLLCGYLSHHMLYALPAEKTNL